MTAVALGESSTEFEPFVSWYRKRPTQLALAASLLVHALLIAAMPGFRSVPLDTPSVLTVQIVSEKVPVEETVAPQQLPEPEPVVRREEALPETAESVELPAPPEFVAPVPQPRPIEQTPVVSRPDVEPQPVPVLQQPEVQPVQEVAQAEIVPVVPREKPQLQPIITSRPELAPEQPVVPVIEPEVTARIDEPVMQPAQVRPEPRVVRQTPANVQQTPLRPEAPQPDAPTPRVAPAQLQPPVVATPSAPAPAPQAAPVKQAAPQAPVAAAPPVTAAVAKPSAPAPVAAPTPPAPPAPVIETVEPSVLEGYRQRVSKEVMQHMKYPRVAVMRKWQGKTVVEMQLSADGAVTRIAIAESSGKEVLDKAALEMVEQSLPRLEKPPRGVRSVKVPVVFRLQG